MEAKNLVDVISGLYGVRTTYAINPTVDNIDNTPTKFLTLNPKRMAFVMVNLSPNSIYIAPVNDVAADRGILVAPNGGAITVDFRDDLVLPSLDWYGIATVNNRDIFVIEVIIY